MKLTLKFAGALALLAATQANAHGLWTENRRGNVEVVYGHGAEDNSFRAEKIKRAWAFDRAGKMIPVTVERMSDHARLDSLQPAAVMAVVLDNGYWSQTPDKKWVNKDRSQVPNAIATTRTLKYSLSINQPGVRLPKLDMLRLAIIPQSDPLKVGPGNELEVQVLIDGKPAADIELYPDYRGAPNQVGGRTDKEGRARIKVRNEGLNVVAAQAAVSGKDDSVDKESFFSSLTFQGEDHHE
ncbi:DUF4198 domain-containing protein [Pseudomonas putida]|uniref:DUF4198 domain-containing protein n=1 Tax=Pseudomonas putida TaxID=303 RepID=UPI001F5235F8|nr:DUF4198 domain-containing protein [Pseudomonas putida]MCI1035897.1 DUF4198 domain-containing protein [Pseudomonas putida]